MKYKIGIIGATGVVGQEIIHWLIKSQFPFAALTLAASPKSIGQKLKVNGRTYTIQTLSDSTFNNLDLAFFCAGETISAQYIPIAVQKGCLAIDNSSAFRMHPNVPLVVPEINRISLASHQGIIANPNCTSAIALMALYPLHKAFGLKRLFASTYQAVSGSGQSGINELTQQTNAWASNEISYPSLYPHPIAFNILPQVGSFEINGYTSEELKMTNEIRKILNEPTLKISTTCVRVPVWRAHSIAVSAEFEKPIDLKQAKKVLTSSPGIELLGANDPSEYPVPLSFTKSAACGVGRLRRDSAFENGLSFWVVGDQLWKGAALNAVQIAHELIATAQTLTSVENKND